MTENAEKRVVVVTDNSDWSSFSPARLKTKLLLACTIRDCTAAQLALSHGADVNCRRSDSMTPLHISAEHDDLRMMRLLCKSSSIQLEAKTMHGLTAMHTAALLDHTKTMRELLKNGAATNCRDHLDRCPLHYAALHSNIKCARYLIASGCLVHPYDVFQESPLHISVLKTKNLSMIRLLLGYRSKRFPLTTQDAQHLLHQAMLSARDEFDMEVIGMILHYGGDVINLSDPIGLRTPLHIVAVTGYCELAEYLMERGADMAAKNRAMQTPMDVAWNFRNFNIVRLIEDKLNSVENNSPGGSQM